MWIFGDNSGNELDFVFGAQRAIPVDTIDWYSWKYIGMWRAKSDTSTSIFKGFEVKRLPSALLANGTIYVDDVQVNGKVTGISGTVPDVPVSFDLMQNYPNPFNPATVISYSLLEACHVSLAVYDILGRKVAQLVDERQASGTYHGTFVGNRLPSGVYLYRLLAGGHSGTRKMILVK